MRMVRYFFVCDQMKALSLGSRLPIRVERHIARSNEAVCRLVFGRVCRSVCAMSESDHSATPSVGDTGVELGLRPCCDPTRRKLILTALATGAFLAPRKPPPAEVKPARHARPHP